MEVNNDKNLILIGTENHVIMINCDLKNRDFSKRKNIHETQESINQIKLMHKPNSTKEILIVVDNSGEIVVITLDLIDIKKKKSKLDIFEVVKAQKYNSKIIFHDNSPWSVDCQYPYIIIGSNNRTVFVFNYEEKENEKENNNEQSNNSIIYKGNSHNVPYVTISDNGAFIGNNSIDTTFKIFDFQTGELICSAKNPKSEWGWGIKFIPKDLFRIINFEFEDENSRKNDNVINSALNEVGMTNYNIDNPSPYEENDENKISYDDLNDYEKYLKLNLIDKSYILTTSNKCAGLYEFDFKLQNNTNKKEVKVIPLGKIELLRIYLRDLFMDQIEIDMRTRFLLNGIKQCSRYEFVFYSKNMNLFLLGSKSGDLHVFEMNIYKDKKNKLICVEDEPNVLISFGEKVAGMKFLDNNENRRYIIDIFVLTLSGMFYYYKISPDINYWESNYE